MGATAHFVDGRWAVFYRQKNTRWAASFPDEKTAKLVAKDAAKRIAAGEDLRPAAKKPAPVGAAAPVGETFRDFALMWLALTWETRAKNTSHFYDGMLKHHLLPVLGDTVLATIDRAVCIDAVSTLVAKQGQGTGKPLGRETRKGVLRVLSVVLQAATDRKRLPFNPALRLGKFVKSTHDAEKIPPVWTVPETARLLAVIQQDAPRWHPFFKIAFRTGLRGGELIELLWAEDFKHPHKLHVQRGFTPRKRTTVHVEQGRLVHTKVMDDDGVGPTKGRQSRLVDLTADVEATFAEQRRLQRAEAFKKRWAQPTLVFVGTRLGHRVVIKNLEIQLRDWCTRAKVPVHPLHATRHTYASVLLMKGLEVDYVAQQLGHRHVITTQQIYRHWLPDAAADQQRVARLDSLWAVKEGQ